MHLLLPLVLSALLFSLGVYGVLARRNVVLVLMSVELMLNAVNLDLVAFDVYLRDALHADFAALALFLATTPPTKQPEELPVEQITLFG